MFDRINRIDRIFLWFEKPGPQGESKIPSSAGREYWKNNNLDFTKAGHSAPGFFTETQVPCPPRPGVFSVGENLRPGGYVLYADCSKDPRPLSFEIEKSREG